MQEITLDDIDREQNSARIWSKFTTRIEDLYRRENMSEQSKSVAWGCVLGILLFDGFIVSDYFVAQQAFHLYAIGRFAFMTPICLLAVYYIPKKTASYQFWICVMPCVMSLTLSVLLISSDGSYRAVYFFGDIMLMMCGCVISRPLLLPALITVIFQAACYHVVLLTSDIVPVDGKIVSSLFCLSGATIALMTLYVLEQSGRRAFLSNLRVRLLNRQLEALTLTDPLTAIGNRRSFEQATRQFWVTASAEAIASLILIDIDHFKLFNDYYGHPSGDICLKNIAACATRQIAGTAFSAAGALVSRFGGEEFIVFLPNAGFTTARQVAESIRREIGSAKIPHPVVTAHPFVSASLGVATSPVRDCSTVELVAHADAALYAAKYNGRNQVWPPIGSVGNDLCTNEQADGRPRWEGAITQPRDGVEGLSRIVSRVLSRQP